MSNPIQDAQTLTFHKNATAAANGNSVDVSGDDGAQVIEIINTDTGSAVVTIEGTFGTTDALGNLYWYSVGYEQRDAVSSPSRTIANISVPASSAHVYLVDDPYNILRVRIISVTGSVSLTAKIKLTTL